MGPKKDKSPAKAQSVSRSRSSKASDNGQSDKSGRSDSAISVSEKQSGSVEPESKNALWDLMLNRHYKTVLEFRPQHKHYPGEAGFAYRPAEMISLDTIAMDLGLGLDGVKEYGTVVAQIVTDEEKAGAYGAVFTFFPLTRAAVAEITADFGDIWPGLRRIQLHYPDHLVPAKDCPDPNLTADPPAQREADDCVAAVNDEALETLPPRGSTPALSRTLDITLRDDVGEVGQAAIKSLAATLYALPSLAIKRTHRDATGARTILRTMRSFMQGHRQLGAKRRYTADVDAVMKVYRVDAFRDDQVGRDADGNRVHDDMQTALSDQVTRLSILTEGMHMDAATWALWTGKINAIVRRPHEQETDAYVACCLKMAYSLFSGVLQLRKERRVHMDIKLPNTGVMFFPLRFFLIDLDCVSTFGLPTHECSTWKDLLQEEMKSDMNEQARITNVYGVYGDFYRVSLALEHALFHKGKAAETANEVRIRHRTLTKTLDQIESRGSLGDRARAIVKQCLDVQITNPWERTKLVKRILKACQAFFADYDVTLNGDNGYYMRDFAQILPDTTTIRFRSVGLL